MEVDVAGDQKYLRAALTNQYNVILFLGAVAFAIGFASWLPVVIALLGEAAWLFLAPRMDTFRRNTDNLQFRADSARAIQALSPEYGPRVAGVERDLAEIEALCAARVDLTPDEKQEVAQRVHPLVQSYVNVCGAHERLYQVSAQAPVHELQAEVSGLLHSLSTETDLGVRASLRRALSVAERRIKQFDGNDSAARSLDLALSTLEKSLGVLKEGAAGLSTGPEICRELDAAMSQLHRAVALEAERETDVAGPHMNALPPALS